MRFTRIEAVFIGAWLLTPVLLWADNFDDQNNLLGRFRTDYNSQTEGSSTNPLTIGTNCPYPDVNDPVDLITVHDTQRCPTGPTVYPGGPFPYANVPFSSTSFFVVSANVEPHSFDDDSLPSQGAPNLSTSLTSSPDILNFVMLPVFPYLGAPNPSHYKASLFIDNEGSNGAKFAGLPFLAIGAHSGHGNSGRVGRMNKPGAPATTTWKSRVAVASAGQGAAYAHFVYAIAKWGGKNRLLFVNLFHYMIDWSTASSPGLHNHWNWPAKDSVYYPGADIGSIDSEDIITHCGSGVGTVPRITSIGATISYSLNWEALFRCTSDLGLFDTPMPETTVPLLGVHWAVEVVGDASLWAMVEQMKMVL